MRWGMVLVTVIIIGLLFIDADDGLWLWWQISVPLLPLLFLIAPGIWRNVCPLATSNQLPRVLNFSRALTPPKWLIEYGFIVGAVAFFGFASSRKWLFNHNGPATGLLILAALIGALLGGYLFKGKSGWCSSICPLYPVQRFYNRTPFATVANAHCNPCVGCTKNCYDFNPGSAYAADLHDNDPHYASYRKFFAAAMPGFIVAYFTLPDPVGLPAVLIMYAQFALYMILSIGLFTRAGYFLQRLGRQTDGHIWGGGAEPVLRIWPAQLAQSRRQRIRRDAACLAGLDSESRHPDADRRVGGSHLSARAIVSGAAKTR